MQNNLELIKSIDVKAVISKETGLNFKKNILEKCPFCSSGSGKSKTPAFSVKISDNIFNCFSCGKKGGVIEFIKYSRGLVNGEAISYLVKNHSTLQQASLVTEPITNLSKKIYAIRQNDKSKATAYLKTRKIETEKLNSSSYYYDSFTNAVVFFDTAAKLINKRFIKPELDKPKALFDKGSRMKNALYDGMFRQNKDTIFLVEGAINALSLANYSSLAIFSTSNQIDNKTLLSRYIKNKNIVLAFDNDKAGQTCTNYYQNFIIENIEVESLSKLSLPEGKDINNLLIENSLTNLLVNRDNYEYFVDNFLLRNSDDIRQDLKDHGFYREDGSYWTEKVTKGKTYPIRISNFLMESLYNFNDGTNDTTRLIKVLRHTGEKHLIEVKSSQTKRNDFQTILKSKRCMFKGGAYELDSILEQLMDNENEATMITDLGFQKNDSIYAFADSVITNNNELKTVNDNGIVYVKSKAYYLPAFAKSNIDNDNYASIRKFRYKEGLINFTDWSKHIYYSWETNGAVAMQFVILSIFRDIVFNSIGFFPYLFLFGAFQTGKTQLMLNLLSIFGNDIGVDLGTVTSVGLSRIISQRINSLFYFKEFTTENSDKAIPFVLTTYDGAGKVTGTKSVGNETSNTLPKSAGVFDGNFLPVQRDAVFSRLILLNFENKNFTERQKKSFGFLENEREHGFSQVLREIFQHRNLFESKFKATFTKMEKEHATQFQARFRRHVALILTSYEILKDVMDFPYSFEELLNKIIEYTATQSDILNEIQDISTFWQAIEYYKSKLDIRKNEHYIKEIEPGSNVGYIFIRYKILYPFYLKYCKENSYNIVDKTSLKELLTSNGNPSFVPGTQKSRGGKAVTKLFREGLDRGTKTTYKFEYAVEGSLIKINDIKIDL